MGAVPREGPLVDGVIGRNDGPTWRFKRGGAASWINGGFITPAHGSDATTISSSVGRGFDHDS